VDSHTEFQLDIFTLQERAVLKMLLFFST